ncbi:regulatory protein RecX, partial [Serratia marcescens]|uniref:regulatory protein RecX n=2 Tax=Serratia TaxID=613 RepID=UPI002380BFD5
ELRRKLAAQPFVAKARFGGKGPHVPTSPPPVAEEPVDPALIDQVIAYCYQHNWLDDKRFAHSYIGSRSRKGYGAQRIRSELMQKGVDKALVQ